MAGHGSRGCGSCKIQEDKGMKYIDREGNITTEDSGQDRFLRWMYNHRTGRMALKILVQPVVSKAGGWLLDSRCSRVLIKPFVKRQGISLDLYERKEYASYNDFFTRQIKKEYRPAEGDADTLISPCDGKLSVYPIDGKRRFSIKGTEYTVDSLLRSGHMARRYQGGYACIFRLTVDDYHRYCYVDNGRKSMNIRIPGVFHTVNPAANEVCPIYKENTREFSLLQSEHFKVVLMMEVGALLVGRITNYHEEETVKKGEEKGRFEFGGSTVILLFQKDAVKFDQRFLYNTENGYETIVKMGERLGEAADKE